MWVWFSKLGSPKWFYELSGKWLPWLIAAMVIFMTVGVVWGLLFVPPDYQQGYTSRILIIHVAVAGTSLAFFPLMAVAGVITMVWRMKLADMVAKCAAPIGAWFSFFNSGDGLYLGQGELGNLVGMDRCQVSYNAFPVFSLARGDFIALGAGRYG